MTITVICRVLDCESCGERLGCLDIGTPEQLLALEAALEATGIFCADCSRETSVVDEDYEWVPPRAVETVKTKAGIL